MTKVKRNIGWCTPEKRRSRVERSVNRLLLSAAAIGALTFVAGCAERPDSSVRPLVDVESYETSLTQAGNDEVKARLEQLIEEVSDLTSSSKEWSIVNTDLVNSAIHDVAFFGSEREVAMYAGGGTISASVAGSSDWAVFTMAAPETASCWGIRFSGDPAYPTIEYANIFSPGCASAQMVSEATWHDQWPEPAPPPTDGTITFGEPLFP